MVNKWKKIQNRSIGNNISIIYKKGPKTIELYRDSLWYNKNMNVIVRTMRKKSIVSALGGTILVKYFRNKATAIKFSKKYMEKN